MIEKLSDSLATLIATPLNLDEDNKEVLAYGAFAVIQTLWSISLVVIFGLVFNVLFESFIISLVGAILRKYSGGAHASTPNRCAIIGVIMSVGLALLISVLGLNSKVILSSIFSLFCFLLTYYCIIQYCPIDTPNKPIVKAEDRVRLKKASLKIVHFFFVLTISSYIVFLSRYNYWALRAGSAIAGGLLSQSLSLTSFGHFIILSLDKVLNSLSSKIIIK